MTHATSEAYHERIFHSINAKTRSIISTYGRERETSQFLETSVSPLSVRNTRTRVFEAGMLDTLHRPPAAGINIQLYSQENPLASSRLQTHADTDTSVTLSFQPRHSRQTRDQIHAWQRILEFLRSPRTWKIFPAPGRVLPRGRERSRRACARNHPFSF